MKLPRLAIPQTIVAAIRTAIYGTFGAVFALSDAEAQTLVDAALTGGILADFLTWLIHSLLLMPQSILHRCYEALIYLAFGCFLFWYAPIDAPSDSESFAIVFLSFMLVAGIKIAFYVADYMTAIIEEK